MVVGVVVVVFAVLLVVIFLSFSVSIDSTATAVAQIRDKVHAHFSAPMLVCLIQLVAAVEQHNSNAALFILFFCYGDKNQARTIIISLPAVCVCLQEHTNRYLQRRRRRRRQTEAD